MFRLRSLLLVVAGAFVILHGILPHHHADEAAERVEAAFHDARCDDSEWDLANLFSHNHSSVSSPDQFLVSSGIDFPLEALLTTCEPLFQVALAQERFWTAYSKLEPPASGDPLPLTTRPPPFA